MAGRVEFKGQIGFKHMAPKTVWQTKTRNGQSKRVPFRTFMMWAEDYTRPKKADNNGTMRVEREPVQVILPEDERYAKVFEYLTAGRRVLVKGRLTHRPKTKENQAGDMIVYPNPICYLETLEFLDEPPRETSRKLINILQELNVINDDTATEYMAALKGHFDSLSYEEDNTDNDKDFMDE